MKHIILAAALLAAAPAFAQQPPAPPTDPQAMIATLADRLQQEMGNSIQREVALRQQISVLQAQLAAAKAIAPAQTKEKTPPGH